MTRARRRHLLPLLPFKLLGTEEHERQRKGHTRRERQASFAWLGAPFVLEYRETRANLPGWSVYERVFCLGPLTWCDVDGEDTSRHDTHFRFFWPLIEAVWPGSPVPGQLPWTPGMIRHLPVSAAFLDAAMRNAAGERSAYDVLPFRRLLGDGVEYPARAPEHLPRLRRAYPELDHFSDGQHELAWERYVGEACPAWDRGFLLPHWTPWFLAFIQEFEGREEWQE